MSATRPSFAQRHAATLRQLRFYAWSFGRSPSSMLGLAIVALFFALAAFGPWIVPYPLDATGAMNLGNRLKPPSAAHWFGTDEMGNDLYSRVILATRTSLWVGVTIVGAATVVGVPLGIAAGYFGGAVRAVIMRVTDVFLSVPGIVLALAIVAPCTSCPTAHRRSSSRRRWTWVSRCSPRPRSASSGWARSRRRRNGVR
jgi:peptide/nickel transport system permease protein